MKGENITGNLRMQGMAVLVMVGLAVLSVLGMVVLEQFRTITYSIFTTASQATINATVHTSLTAFIAGLALFGTFATVTALIVVVKAIIGIVKGMQ